MSSGCYECAIDCCFPQQSCEYEQAIIGPNRLLPGEYARFLQYCQSLRIIPAPLHQQAAAADQGSDEEDDTDRKPLPNDEAKAIIIPEFSQATESESQGGYNESRSTGYDDLHADMEKGSSGSDSVDYSECHGARKQNACLLKADSSFHCQLYQIPVWR